MNQLGVQQAIFLKFVYFILFFFKSAVILALKKQNKLNTSIPMIMVLLHYIHYIVYYNIYMYIYIIHYIYERAICW